LDHEFHVIIPARLASGRLPRKVLLDIAGKSMLERVYRQAEASGAASVHVATADQEVVEAAEAFGAPVLLTSASHASGTERSAEAADALGLEDDEVVINLQADEPLLPSSCIRKLGLHMCEKSNIKIATLSTALQDPSLLFDPHTVKVVCNQRGYALYFSRAPIPWGRATFSCDQPEEAALTPLHQQHIGLYAFRKQALMQCLEWDPCLLAETEALEQLRILWLGGRIHVLECTESGPFYSVDTEEDLARVRDFIRDQA
jgi:3-deoxy-manno-octulosonate cytidylyltransferase (CMP-KDO synthetase)